MYSTCSGSMIIQFYSIFCNLPYRVPNTYLILAMSIIFIPRKPCIIVISFSFYSIALGISYNNIYHKSIKLICIFSSRFKIIIKSIFYTVITVNCSTIFFSNIKTTINPFPIIRNTINTNTCY